MLGLGLDVCLANLVEFRNVYKSQVIALVKGVLGEDAGVQMSIERDLWLDQYEQVVQFRSTKA